MMTNDQFEALATLVRSRSKTKEAVRMVLVEGAKASSAAEITGLDRSTVSNALKAFRRTLEIAKIAVNS